MKIKTEFLQKTSKLDLKVQKKLTLLAVALRKKQESLIQMFPTKRQDQNWNRWYSKVFKNQTEEHLVNLCKSNKFETQVILPHSLHSYNNELARILFPVQSMGKIKLKMTCNRVAADGCICIEILIINVCCVSQSVIYQVLYVSARWCVF